MAISDLEYRRWLKAAYDYYWGFGSEMSDHEWDSIGKKINPEEHAELKGTNYEPGQSLYWLSKDKYPNWCKE